MDIVIYGLISGSVILMASIGFSMTLKAEGFINIAHGQMLLVGAYLGLLFTSLGIPFLLALVLVVICGGVLGVFIFQAFFAPIKARGTLALLFTSVGLAYVMYGLVGMFAGKRMLAYDLPPVRAYVIDDTPIMTIYEIAIVAAAILSALGIHLFLSRTWLGKSIRAVADNIDLARIRGFDPRHSSNVVWFVASGLAALAGVFLGVLGSLHLQMGWQQSVIILAATVLGGLGSIYGVMLAAVVLGFGMEIGILFLPTSYRTAIAFAIIIVVLCLKPDGLQSLWGGAKARRF